jgi:hypothetical protein
VRRHSSCLYLRTVYREAHYKWLMKGGKALNERRRPYDTPQFGTQPQELQVVVLEKDRLREAVHQLRKNVTVL